MEKDDNKLKVETEIWLALGVLLVLLIATGVYSYLASHYKFLIDDVTGYWPPFLNGLRSLFGYIEALCIVLSVIFFLGIIYAVEGLKKARNREEELMTSKVETAFDETGKAAQGDPELERRWRAVLEHVESSNENDWRQAILEADIMLEDLLIKLGYRGEGVGERLKRAREQGTGDFKTLDQAWEAHIVRNNIAHEGSAYPLNQIEARRVIGLFRQVFEEFYHM